MLKLPCHGGKSETRGPARAGARWSGKYLQLLDNKVSFQISITLRQTTLTVFMVSKVKRNMH